MVRGKASTGALPFTSLFSPPETVQLSKAPEPAGGALPMAELLPQLPWPPSVEGGVQDSSVPAAEWQNQQPRDGRAEGPSPETWRLPEVPSIHITPSSDGESPPCTPTPQRLRLPRTPDLESLPQDRSDPGVGTKERCSLSRDSCSRVADTVQVQELKVSWTEVVK